MVGVYADPAITPQDVMDDLLVTVVSSPQRSMGVLPHGARKVRQPNARRGRRAATFAR